MYKMNPDSKIAKVINLLNLEAAFYGVKKKNYNNK